MDLWRFFLQDIGFPEPINLALLKQALTHRSSGKENNERLEFLGDGILNMMVASLLYARFPNADEGLLSNLRATLVCGRNLAHIARDINLEKYLIIQAQQEKNGLRDREALRSDALEALIGYIYLSYGHQSCLQWLTALFSRQLDELAQGEQWMAEKSRPKNPKSILQEWLQKRRKCLPHYRLLKQEGPPHKPIFHIECAVDGLDSALIGIDSSLQKAEIEAAEKALWNLQEKYPEHA